MFNKSIYESPTCAFYEIAVESVLCASTTQFLPDTEFGNEKFGNLNDFEW